jgi:hypothetical protein
MRSTRVNWKSYGFFCEYEVMEKNEKRTERRVLRGCGCPRLNSIKFTIHVSDRVFAALDRNWNARSRVWPNQIDRSHLVISSSLCLFSSSPVSRTLSHFPAFISLRHVHLTSQLLPFLSLSQFHFPLLLHRSPAPPSMHHIVTWVGRRHKGNAQQKSVVRCDTSTKGESQKKKDMEATGPCHVDLGSGHVSPLNSTSRSNDEDVSTCNDYAITGRYLLRLAPPYNRQTSIPGPYHLNCGVSDANFSLSDFSGQHQSHLTTC